jgi:hypothetical protein
MTRYWNGACGIMLWRRGLKSLWVDFCFDSHEVFGIEVTESLNISKTAHWRPCTRGSINWFGWLDFVFVCLVGRISWICSLASACLLVLFVYVVCLADLLSHLVRSEVTRTHTLCLEWWGGANITSVWGYVCKRNEASVELATTLGYTLHDSICFAWNAGSDWELQRTGQLGAGIDPLYLPQRLVFQPLCLLTHKPQFDRPQ